jgi:hypothetical protein
MIIKFGEHFLLHSGKNLFVSPSPTYIHEDKNHKTVSVAVVSYGFVSHPEGGTSIITAHNW